MTISPTAPFGEHIARLAACIAASSVVAKSAGEKADAIWKERGECTRELLAWSVIEANALRAAAQCKVVLSVLLRSELMRLAVMTR